MGGRSARFCSGSFSGVIPIPTALTIAGSDSGGGAGIQADLKTFLACRVHGMSAITAVTVQNSLGVSGFYELPPAAVAEQIESVASDIGVGAAKTGMLASAAIIAAVAETIARLGVGPIVVDPVAASQHGDALLRPDALDALRSLILPLAALVTPNLGEVRLLTGIDVIDVSSAREAALALHSLGAAAALVKGGHLPAGDAIDVLYDGESFVELSAPRLPTEHTHGSGDTLAASICAGLARGLPLVDAVRAGKAYISAAVADSYPLGAGLGPVGHFWRIRPLD
jgi:hydroxymethylpyrimidine/phosphomethylpyrimidine kinase